METSHRHGQAQRRRVKRVQIIAPHNAGSNFEHEPFLMSMAVKKRRYLAASGRGCDLGGMARGRDGLEFRGGWATDGAAMAAGMVSVAGAGFTKSDFLHGFQLDCHYRPLVASSQAWRRRARRAWRKRNTALPEALQRDGDVVTKFNPMLMATRRRCPPRTWLGYGKRNPGVTPEKSTGL